MQIRSPPRWLMIVSSAIGRLAGLAVADDQLALAAADRDHGVDRLDAGLDRRVHGRAQHHARGDALDGPRRPSPSGSGPLPSIGSPSGLTTRPISSGPDRHRGDAAGAADLVAFLDLGIRPDDHDADRLFFEVQGDAHHALLGELDQLEGADVAQAVDAGDAVADLDDRADLAGFDGGTRSS